MGRDTCSEWRQLAGAQGDPCGSGSASCSMWMPVALGRSMLLGVGQFPLVSLGAWRASSSLTQSGCVPTRALDYILS